jgi:hypothetical protein
LILSNVNSSLGPGLTLELRLANLIKLLQNYNFYFILDSSISFKRFTLEVQ